MASLRDTVREYQDDLRSGIAWLTFWREGRSWHGEAFHLDMSDYLYPEDKMRLAEIQATDPKAVVVNGYYSGYLGEEISVDELAAGVRHHYENGLSNIAPFMEAHDDVLPPEVLEKARAKAHEAGLPFYERPYNDEDIDPYVYDGYWVEGVGSHSGPLEPNSFCSGFVTIAIRFANRSATVVPLRGRLVRSSAHCLRTSAVNTLSFRPRLTFEASRSANPG